MVILRFSLTASFAIKKEKLNQVLADIKKINIISLNNFSRNSNL